MQKHTHILTHMCPLPLTRVAFLQRICFNLQNKSKSRYISASAGPYVFNPLLLFFSLSILSQYSFLPLTARSNSVRPLGDHVWKSHTSHDFLLVHDYSTRLINRGRQFRRLNDIRMDRGVNRIVNSVHSNVRSNAVFLVWLISNRSCVFWQENGEQHIKHIYHTHTWFKSIGLVIFFMF